MIKNIESAFYTLNKRVFVIIIWSFICLFQNNLLAQGIDCPNAENIVVNGSCDTATSITQNINTAICGGTNWRRVGYYSFTVSSGPSNVTITADSNNRNLVLGLFSGACGALTNIQCVDANTTNGVQTETITSVLNNGTYYLAVGNTTNNNMTLNSLCVTSVVPTYCSYSTTDSSYWISNFRTTGGFTNINNTTTYSAGGYGNFSATNIVNQSAGLSFNFNTTMSSGTHGINIWVDWNNDLDFADAGEKVYASGGYVSNASGTITIPALTTAGNYRMRVTTNWSGTDPAACGTSTYTEAEDYTIQVSPPPTCFSPSLTSNATSTTTGTASWTPSGSGTIPVGYEYVISTSNTVPVGSGTAIATTSTNFTGLTPSTTYYVFVRSNCGGGDFSNWTSSSFFTEYCSFTTSSSAYWISNFNTTGGFININNSTTYSAGGYGNFSTTGIVNQSAGLSFNFNTTMSSGTHGINIWVDWNKDLDFNDPGEKVYASGGYVSTASGTITIPLATLVGNYRMRVVSNYSSTDPAACGTSTYTEAEDYTIQVSPPPTCYAPSLTSNATSTTTGTATWTAPSSGTSPVGYEYVISTTNTLPAGSGTATTLTSINFTALTPATTYYVFVRSNCGGGDFSNWTSSSFYTEYCAANNNTNTTYFINNITTTNGVSNINNTGTGFTAGGYANYTSQFVSNNAGLSFNISATHPSSSYGYTVWVDWNNDFDFNDPGENVLSTDYLTSPAALGTVTIPPGTPAGNYRMRIRNAYLSNPAPACGNFTYGETEDYTVRCLGPLPCAGFPSNVIANVTSQTTVTIDWTAASPAPANGYQYYLSTTNTAPGAATTPTGSVGAGVTTLNLTGLISGTTYYIWVRSNCGGGLGAGAWNGPVSFIMPTCAVGNSLGTSSLGCPSVVSGGLGLNGADPAAISCSSGSSCVDLEATYLQLGNTNSYTAQPITYAPPYQFNCLKNPVSVNVDDVWSPTINLPFNFCFYGNNYNQCLISSNGVLTFDTATNTPGSYSTFSFATDLPTTALFENSIFGVYHDIDPSVGGEVGWELITLNSGCRALVASWHDIPMYSATCNSQLYTGMIVLYENTNIIEVYIEEKNVCGSWNDGNAVVGVQNATGTAASVAPGRNSLDTNWTVTNEAWRFVPSGTSITSIKWYEGSGTSGTVVGTTDVINVCPTATTTYTAEVTYTLCNGTTLKETEETTVTVSGSKVWNGSVSSNWAIPLNWSPVGIPTTADCVVIPPTANNPVISGISYTANGLSLSVQNGASLTVNSGNNLNIIDRVNISPTGDLYLQNSASLVQTNNVVNTGSFRMDRTANIRQLDYVVWSSPTNSFGVTNVSPGTSTNFIFEWLPTTVTSYASNFGLWSNTTSIMSPGKGYIIRGPSTYTSTLQNYTATLTGIPNNGNISIAITRGTYNGANYVGPTTSLVTKDDDNWNLLGNPYPSAVNAISFLTNNTNVAGFIKVWTHGTLPSSANADPYYTDYTYNYTLSDYITYNSTGVSSGPGIFGGNIASGQGFFVLMNNGSPTPGTISFTNSMRSTLNDNSQFFRTQDPSKSDTVESNENGKIWLDIISSNGTSFRTLVGYVENATNDLDRMYDATANDKETFRIYSICANEKQLIQGRGLPFSSNDKVNIGYTANETGNYTIAIGAIEGFLTNTNIYLEDLKLNSIHDLKSQPYSFSSESGDFSDRFILRYNTKDSVDTNQNTGNELLISTTESVNLYSSNLKIKDIRVYDVLGRILYSKENLYSNNVNLTEFKKTNNSLIIMVTYDNNTTETKKIIF